MKKCYSFLLMSCCILFSANSQILIDGNMSDWNSVPILSEPGVYPYAKLTSDGTSIFYKVDFDASNAFNTNGPGLESFIDADCSSATGAKSDWLFISSGNDYFIQGLSVFNYNGTPGANEWAWNWLSFRDGNRAFSADFRTLEQKLLISDLSAMSLSANYSIAFGYVYSTASDPYVESGFIPQSDANFAQRKSFTIKPRTVVSLSSTTDFTSGNAYYHPFMNDANIAQYIDFQSGAFASDNPKQWASWAVNLVTPGVYDFKMTTKSTGSGQAVLSLVDMATNAVVKTFDAVWYPINATMIEDSYGTIDLSDVPAGQYMLKLSTTSAWDTFLKVEKVTLKKVTTTIGDEIKSNEFVNLIINSNILNISVSSPAEISIYALNGKLVSAYKNITSINKKLESGAYMVVARLGEKQFSKKVIIKN